VPIALLGQQQGRMREDSSRWIDRTLIGMPLGHSGFAFTTAALLGALP
jgi:hypothetical protein